MRHKGNLEVSINIDVKKLNDLLPPLSLQILVENAIKHNVISQKRPLLIKLFNENDTLLATNNLQLKDNVNESTKLGLKILSERYKHISELIPEFYIKDKEYVAKLPLLKEE